MVTFLYLHGVGQGVRDEFWRDALAGTLRTVASFDVPEDELNIVAPDYVDLLKHPPERDSRSDAPKVTSARMPKDELRRAQWRYSQAQARLTAGLPGVVSSIDLQQHLTTLQPSLDRVPTPTDLKDAKRYLTNRPLRNAVLQRVISKMAGQREFVIVAHSLGSVVAVDLLDQLPRRVKVPLLLTIGSPLGQLYIQKSDPERVMRHFPLEKVENWINVVSLWDPVTWGVGASRAFPQAADVHVRLPFGVHASHRYLASPTATEVLRRCLEPVAKGDHTEPVTQDVGVRVSNEEEVLLNGLAYAGLVQQRLEGDRATRYDQARRLVQMSVVRELVESRGGFAIPDRLLEAEDGRRPPDMVSSGDLSQDLTFAIVSATSNALAPYDMDVSARDQRDVVATWKALGYLDSDGERVAKALISASRAFDSPPWQKYALAAVGLAMVVVAPVGLIAAVPAGVAGAAAITASLAAFGPGGMLGGMVLAGGLIGGGSATAAVAGIAAFSEAMLETEVVRRMAISLAHRELGLNDDFTTWRLFAFWHSQLANELESHREVSDESSPTVKALRDKIDVLETAMSWMVSKKLAPGLGV